MRTLAILAASLGQGEPAVKKFNEFQDALFPENEESREKFIQENSDLLRRATEQGPIAVQQIAPPVVGKDRLPVLPDRKE